MTYSEMIGKKQVQVNEKEREGSKAQILIATIYFYCTPQNEKERKKITVRSAESGSLFEYCFCTPVPSDSP